MKLCVLFIFFFIFSVSVFADADFLVAAKLDNPYPSATETVAYTIEISYKEGYNIQVISLSTPFSPQLKPCGQKIIREKHRKNGEEYATIRYCYYFQPQAAGDITIDPVKINYSENNVESSYITNPVTLSVKEPFDFKWIIAGSTATIIAVLFFFARKKNPQEEPVDENALNLEDSVLSCQRALARGDVKDFYASVSECIRIFCSLYYSLESHSTAVLIEDISNCRQMPQNIRDSFCSLLEKAEIVKFSAMLPDDSENKHCLRQLKKCLEKSSPEED